MSYQQNINETDDTLSYQQASFIPPGKVFSRIGISLALLLLFINISQLVLIQLVSIFWPSLAASTWFTWILLGVSFYATGFPLYYLLMKPLPNAPKKEPRKMSPSHFIIVFIICMGTAYIFNLVGAIINYMVSIPLGTDIPNPLNETISGSGTIPIVLFACILSPIFEELVFRKIMLDKIKVYGDKVAIFLTALTFGLFHGNLSQFFYAMSLGLILAYLAVRTNTIKYSVLLHILINLFGSIVMPGLALSENIMYVALSSMLLLFFIIAGIIFFAFNVKNIRLEQAAQPIERSVFFQTVYGNTGMLLFFFLSFLSFLIYIFSPYLSRFLDRLF